MNEYWKGNSITDTSRERDLKEFEEVCRPVVEYIQKKHHPNTWIIIEWDRATLTEDTFGVPFQVPD